MLTIAALNQERDRLVEEFTKKTEFLNTKINLATHIGIRLNNLDKSLKVSRPTIDNSLMDKARTTEDGKSCFVEFEVESYYIKPETIMQKFESALFVDFPTVENIKVTKVCKMFGATTFKVSFNF